MKKTYIVPTQPIVWAINPPSIKEIRGKITIIAVIKDNFSAASVLLKLSLIITLAIDIQAAAPSPWITRIINKNSILGEKTEVILDATKRKLPVKRMGRLPYRSEKNPKTNCPTPAAIMKTGKVKFYNAEKGFGFIIDNETSKDVFVHRSGLIDTINEDDEVSFEIKDGQKGPNAVDVKLAR